MDNIPDNVRPIPPKGNDIPESDLATIKEGLAELQRLINDIGQHDLLPDVLIYEKAVRWAIEYKEIYNPKGTQTPAANVKKVLAAGLQRAQQLRDGKTPWTTQTGPVLRGYRSKIDRSVQPYWLIVPANYASKGDKRHRLDLWWHGRSETLSEANFMANPANASGIIPAPGAFILHPYGRYCNANKFAGEIDTFECLDHVRKHYRIDDNQLVARGFSMGGAACWHFSVHYPTLWAASAPGAGFSETPEFLKVFQKEEVKPTWYEQKLWRMYNATDYCENLFNLPTGAYSGEIDSQKQAADVMAREMKKFGLEFKHIIGPKTGHSYEKSAREEVNRLIDGFVEKGKPKWWDRQEIRFVTYTLRYAQCDWLTITGLEKHWEPGRIAAKIESTKIEIATTGISAFVAWVPEGRKAEIVVDGTSLGIYSGAENFARAHYFHKDQGKWTSGPAPDRLAKRPGLQGPIDDAFMDSFIMVKPSGQPMNSKTAAWVNAEFQHAVSHWRSQFRGDALVKSDTEITDEDMMNSHLILWGDPMSNAVIAKIVPKLPIQWTEKGIQVGGQTYPVGTHVPVLIYPNPLHPQRYIVLNSGFTFREYDYLNNARQVPKLPDYAILDITTPPNSRYPGKVIRAGFFGEKWELLPNDGQ